MKPPTWVPNSMETGDTSFIRNPSKTESNVNLEQATRVRESSPPPSLQPPGFSYLRTLLIEDLKNKTLFISNFNIKSPLDLICANARHVIPPSTLIQRIKPSCQTQTLVTAHGWGGPFRNLLDSLAWQWPCRTVGGPLTEF